MVCRPAADGGLSRAPVQRLLAVRAEGELAGAPASESPVPWRSVPGGPLLASRVHSLGGRSLGGEGAVQGPGGLAASGGAHARAVGVGAVAGARPGRNGGWAGAAGGEQPAAPTPACGPGRCRVQAAGSHRGPVPAEKTRQLLFRGARACADPAWEDGCAVVDLPESPKPGPTEAPRATRGQMLIGPDGRLTRRGAQAFEAGE